MRIHYTPDNLISCYRNDQAAPNDIAHFKSDHCPFTKVRSKSLIHRIGFCSHLPRILIEFSLLDSGQSAEPDLGDDVGAVWPSLGSNLTIYLFENVPVKFDSFKYTLKLFFICIDEDIVFMFFYIIIIGKGPFK